MLTIILTMIMVSCGSAKLSTEEILAKQTEASKEIKSGKMKMDIDMNMTFGEESQKMNVSSESEYTVEPFAMKMTETTNVGEESMESVSYMDKDFIYYEDTELEETHKVALSDMGVNIEDMIEKMSSDETMAMLKEHEKNIVSEEKGDTYVLSYTGSGEELKEIVNKTMANSVPPEIMMMLGEMNIGDYSYTTIIDKKTFLPISIETILDMSMDIEGKEIKIDQKQKIEYSDLNSDIKVEMPEVE